VREHQILTRLACSYCKELESKGAPVPSFAKDWWTTHKIEDEMREEREKQARIAKAKKKQALNKLTPAERALLGF